MSDNLRRYRAIRDALIQWYPGPPTGTVARHLTTLAALISGIVGSKSTQLPTVATKIPDGTKPESRVKRLTRWLDNEHILEEVYFVPYIDILLTQLALETLVVVMDGMYRSTVFWTPSGPKIRPHQPRHTVAHVSPGQAFCIHAVQSTTSHCIDAETHAAPGAALPRY
jgi:hypothetical protein